ncbi:UNVERIFIED_CONTAM: hypothetical protein K2H54_058022 [Gekko kuhli]
MEAVNQLASKGSFRAVKEPLAFLRVLEWCCLEQDLGRGNLGHERKGTIELTDGNQFPNEEEMGLPSIFLFPLVPVCQDELKGEHLLLLPG